MAADSSTSMEKRRVSKPLIEKRRRARINSSLSQLKEIVASSKKQESRSNRLEKADILELTVAYVKNIHNSNIPLQKPRTSEAPSNKDLDHSFEDGYRLCMLEVEKFFANNTLKSTTKEFLSHALQAYLQRTFFNKSTRNGEVLTKRLSSALVKEPCSQNEKTFHQMESNDGHQFDYSENSSSSSNSIDEIEPEASNFKDKAKELLRLGCSNKCTQSNFDSPQSMWRPW